MRIVAVCSDVCSSYLRLPVGVQPVGLAVVDHLQAMLDSAEQAIGRRQALRLGRGNPSCFCERGERVQRRRRAQARLAPAMDELVHLSEKLDLANAALATLEIESGAKRLALRIMTADAAGAGRQSDG